VTITLRTPKKQAALIKRLLVRRGKLVRKPTITVKNLTTGASRSVTRRITVRRRR
jgi:hypothetical protein